MVMVVKIKQEIKLSVAGFAKLLVYLRAARAVLWTATSSETVNGNVVLLC